MIFMGQPIGAMAGYPNNNTPADKATYSFSLDIPTTITAGTGAGPAAAISNGVLESKTVNGARTTWVWDQDQPMASELALISDRQVRRAPVDHHPDRRLDRPRVVIHRLGAVAR